jgi:hypothetical protein
MLGWYYERNNKMIETINEMVEIMITTIDSFTVTLNLLASNLSLRPSPEIL